jgi:ABC-type Co2+ transport system permease subunit
VKTYKSSVAIAWCLSGVLLWLLVSLLTEGFSELIRVNFVFVDSFNEGCGVALVGYVMLARKGGVLAPVVFPLCFLGFVAGALFGWRQTYNVGPLANAAVCGALGAFSSWALTRLLRRHQRRPFIPVIALLAGVIIAACIKDFILNSV